ncbi:MAG TPA: FprA family A-type flavoprotein [Candidatus Blautia gallistercoris]|uniref:FprA family A-type flavoprotein n=1 Tax=Candidatus Blautia gallistercoris TaxID=2838490 RepID=A0A9D1WFP9_9FIRM|nr:FprA family A-type flavoprotein [Candidatus Blautia gallistercoris]
MNNVVISDSIKYVGVDDTTIDLFESQYLVPNGVSYNSYVILDEKTAIMDTVDKRGTEGWLQNLTAVLGDRKPDYLVVSHMEPDHAGNIQRLMEQYPDMQVVSTAKAIAMMPQFFTNDFTGKTIAVKEGDTLELGTHTLHFVMAPMVHWPEVMVSYESSEKVLFSADGFGTFGALEKGEEWIAEARRYFINIVGKYGAQVQALLKKATTLDIAMICPLHGPVLKENLGYYLEKYNTWSSYQPEDDGVVVACASIHGNTMAAGRKLAEILKEKGAKEVVFFDLSRSDMAEVVENAYRYDKLVVACPTYDASIFPVMEDFLYHLKIKNFQNRKVAIMENGSWAPMAGKLMREAFSSMKNITLCENQVTIRSSMKDETVAAMEQMAEELLG